MKKTTTFLPGSDIRSRSRRGSWLLACLLVLLPALVRAQSSPWTTATTGSPTQVNGSAQTTGTAVDANGDVFVTGYFSGLVSFGPHVLRSAGYDDLFVAKWLPATGTWAWAQSGGGTSQDRGLAIAVSGSSVYVTGSIMNTSADANAVRFGGTAMQYGASTTSNTDLVVVKYTDAGSSATVSWTQVAGGTSYDEGTGIAVSGSSVYVTGNFSNSTTNTQQVVFGGAGTTAGTAVQHGATSTLSRDMVVAKYTDNGPTATFRWSQVGGGADYDTASGIAVSGSSVYIIGTLPATGTFGGTGSTPGTVTQAANQDLLVAKYTDNGASATLGWTQVAGGTNKDEGHAIAANGSSVYVTGYITNSTADTYAVRFGGTGTTAGTAVQRGTAPLDSFGSSYPDLVVAKYTDNGTTATFRWSQVGGGAGHDEGHGLAVSGTGVYVTGYVSNNTTNDNAVKFGGSGSTAGTVTVNGVTTQNYGDVLVAKYLDNGASATLRWTQVGGGRANDVGTSLAVSGSSVYLSSRLGHQVSFTENTGTAAFGTATGSPVRGTSDYRGMLAQLQDNTTTAAWQAVAPVTTGGTSETKATAVDVSGNVFVTGSFTGQVSFGSTMLYSAGGDDLFVAKYLPATDTWAWAQSGGGNQDDAGQGIAVSGSSVYVTGYLTTDPYTSSVRMGATGTSAGTLTMLGRGGTDLLVAKYTDNGTSASLGWTQVGAGYSEDAGTAIAVNGSSVYVTGYLTNTLNDYYAFRFGSTGVNGAALGTAAQYGTYGGNFDEHQDLVVAKYTDNGPTATFRWSQVGGGSFDDRGNGVAVSGSNVYVTGYISNTRSDDTAVRFGGTGATVGTARQYGASSSYGTDLVVAKYVDNGTTGTLRWTQVGGGSQGDQGAGIAASGSSVYVVGSITGTATFGGSGTAAGTTTQAANYASDVLVAKYTDNGTTASLAWTQAGGGTSYDYGTGIAVSGSTVVVTGSVNNTTTDSYSVRFGSAAVAGSSNVSNTSLNDLLLARYTDNGPTATCDWAQASGGDGDDRGAGIVLLGNTVYVGGKVVPSASFGSLAVSSLLTSKLTLLGILDLTRPGLSKVSPTKGVAGTAVTLSGFNLGGATSLVVNGVSTPISSNTGTSLRFEVPAGASATQLISLTTPAGMLSVTTFVVELRVTGSSPLPHARSAPGAGSAVAFTFTEPVSSASAAGIRVFSGQAGGRKAGTVSLSGNTASFAAATGPTADFRPGEVVSVSLPATVQNLGGLSVAARVQQFTTATGGTGSGNYLAPATNAEPAVGPAPAGVVLGDVDGDGDLDLLTANPTASTVSLRLNDGTSSYTAPPTNAEIAVGGQPAALTLGDVDGDGDLDLLTANSNNNTVSVRLNDGSGSFPGGTEVPVDGGCVSLALGDLDGDGDLDLATANQNTGTSNFSIRANDGLGGFTLFASSPFPYPLVSGKPRTILLADMDNDRDLDLVAGFDDGSQVYILFNYRIGPTPQYNAYDNNGAAGPCSVATGDLNGDGYQDLVITNASGTTVSVRINTGNATFYSLFGSATVNVDAAPQSVALGDVDADGDLDFVTANQGGTVSIRLNGGAGTFTPHVSNPNPAVGTAPLSLALGDVDNDGDLDLVTANSTANTVSLRLNAPPSAFITGFSPTQAVAGTSVTITGLALAGATALTVNGVATPITANTTTSLSFVVPAGGSATQLVVVTTPQGTASSSAFTVRLAVAGRTPAANAPAAPVAGSALALTFSEPVTAASLTTTASSIKAFGSQAGGRKAGTWTGGGTASVSYTSSLPGTRADFKPGETVSVTVPASISSAGGLSATKLVYQLTAATGGTGRGNFLASAAAPDAATGTGPNTVVLGDVNNDGTLDMLTPNYTANTVSVRLGNGSGAFTAPTTNPNPSMGAGTSPHDLALGDLDGDGDLDMVVANAGNATVAVRLNSGLGSGNFTGSQNVATGTSTRGVALGDIDGDGDLDLLAANFTASTVSIRFNDGNGTFIGGTNLALGATPQALTLGDVDGDGDLDLVTANYTANTVSVRLNDGSGTFTGSLNLSIGTGSSPFDVVLGDVDDDGDPDLLVANYGASTVSVRLNNGSGTFTSPATGAELPVAANPYTIALGDVDADGDLDVVTPAYGSGLNQASVLLNDGSGAFAAPAANANPPAGNRPVSVALGDVDNDGDLDFVAANYDVNTVSIRLNQPTSPILSSFTPASAPAGTTVAVTGSYLAGLSALTVNGVNALPSVTNSTATGFSFTVPAGASATQNVSVTTLGVSTSSAAFAVRLPVLSTSPVANALTAPTASSALSLTFAEPVTAASLTTTASSIKVFSSQVGGRKAGTWTGGGTATASYISSLTGARTAFRPGERVSVSVPATIVGTGGLPASRQVYQFTTATGGTGRGNFVPGTSPAVGTSPRHIAVGDVDGDGDLDLVTANYTAATLSVRLNGGNASGTNTGVFAAPAIVANGTVSVGTNPICVVLGDVDGDGDLDLLAVSANTNAVSIRLNSGAGVFSGTGSVATGVLPQWLALGDVDADGDLDLVTANYTAGTVSVRLNSGNGTFTVPALNANPAVGTQPRHVALGDVDGDGDLDLLTANSGDDALSLLLNDGTGSFSPPATNASIAVGDLPYSVELGDVDGDGDLDAVAANYTASTLSVRLNDGEGSFTAPTTNADLTMSGGPTRVVLGDVDADGDLDLLTSSFDNNTTGVLLNDGTGSFAPPAANATPAVGTNPQSLALGDVDGDGDLDFVTGNSSANTVSVRLNIPEPIVLSTFSPASAPAGTTVAVTGSNLAGLTALTVNGVNALASVSNGTATGFSFVVPAGASATQSIAATAANGNGTSSTAFTVLLPVAGTSPAANALAAAAANSAVALTFTEPVTAASAAGIRVFSAQAGGRKAGTVSVSGSTASFAATASTPRTHFKPGETVQVVVPGTVLGAGGLAASKWVYQFTTAVGGTGQGNFVAPAINAEPGVDTAPQDLAVGDVDGDGDLDFVTPNFGGSTVSIRLNDGTGSFSAPTTNATVSVSANPMMVALGDVDGDGDLDLLAASGSVVSVRLNSGLGVFTAPATNPNPTTDGNDLGSFKSLVLGDVDDDGDLDFLTSNYTASTVSVRLNNGSGSFTAPATNPNPSVANSPMRVALGDVDSDGDLDFVTAEFFSNSMSVRLNDGSGNFTAAATSPAVGTGISSLALGDVDGDGDLDLVAGGGTVKVRFNDGLGVFTSRPGTFEPFIGDSQRIALGDVDGDGDLDLLVPNATNSLVSVRLNNGTGFSSPPVNASPAVGLQPQCVALGDVDGDGDLDFLTANRNSPSVSVRLNAPQPLTLTNIYPSAELPGMPVTLTGTGFTAGSTVSFGGVAASSVTYTSATRLTAVVPAGTTVGNSAVVVSNGGGSSPGGPAFTVLGVYDGGALDACAAAVPATATINNGQWNYLLSGPDRVVLAYRYTGANLGSFSAEVLRADPASPVRQDGRSQKYLDRNWHLTASGGSFAGRTVQLRFYGLLSEQVRLQAADAAATLANLKATQYSGANEDCQLGNNDFATGDFRVLPATASTPAGGVAWFVSELTVADHFSEFYLTGSAAPLPVELLTFTATKQGSAVALAWRTASEQNSASFIIERSRDGRTFERIGEVAAQGSKASPTDYTFRDSQYPGETSLLYYRLRQVDRDGSTSYSPVRTVTIGSKGSLTLYPNPARTSVVVGGLSAGASVEVFDALGRPVVAAVADAGGTAQLALPAGLAAGVYIVRSSSQAQRLTVE